MTKPYQYLVMLWTVYLVTACSTYPQNQYKVTVNQSLSYKIFKMADRKRQLEQFDLAIGLYLESEKYALKRNDKYLIGLSMLKRASIQIDLKNPKPAATLLTQVRTMNMNETLDLAGPILFIDAKLAKLNGDILLAINKLQILQKSYANNIEKQIYYNTVSSVYQSQNIKTTTMMTNINILDNLLKENNLNNIEIYSYVIYQYAKMLAHAGNSQAEKMIFNAINHFSNLELPNRISACYQLAGHYYEMVGNKEKASYYQQQTKIIY